MVISEFMYRGTPPAGTTWVELFNTESNTFDLKGHRLVATSTSGGGWLDVTWGVSQSVLPGTFFTVDGALPPDDGTLRLLNPAGGVLLEVNYSSKYPWPGAATVPGASLVLARPSYGEGSPDAWAVSERLGGSKGVAEPAPNLADTTRYLLINEVLHHSDCPHEDFVEIFNPTAAAISLNGLVLGEVYDDQSTPLPNLSVPAQGFVVFKHQPATGATCTVPANELGFGLNAAGSIIYLSKPAAGGNPGRIIDGITVPPQNEGIPLGRYPDGMPDWYRVKSSDGTRNGGGSPGVSNPGILEKDVVINEIMYAPISGDPDDTYVEIRNLTASALDLSGWRLSGPIKFIVPTGVSIPASGYLVIARNPGKLFTRYPQLNSANTLGSFSGTLTSSGRLSLSSPDSTTDEGVETSFFVEIDVVEYRGGGRWGRWANAGGSSLELIQPANDGRRAANWADSDESSKASWNTGSLTKVLTTGDAVTAFNALEISLQGEGECLLDSVEVHKVTSGAEGPNLLTNPGFESDLAGWTVIGGNHTNSTVVLGGAAGAKSLLLKSWGKGDYLTNRLSGALSSALAANDTVVIRAALKWRRGSSQVLFRLRGNAMEWVANLVLPANLGSPGLVNSQNLVTSRSVIFDVSHAPAIPSGTLPITVTARANPLLPPGQSMVIKAEWDGVAGSATTVPMLDNGVAPDARANDGIYSANVSKLATGTLLRFYVQLNDSGGTALTTFPADAPARLCLARWETDVSKKFGKYRVWMVQSNISHWGARSRIDHTPLDATFVYGTSTTDARIFYNMGMAYAGTPEESGSYNGPAGSVLPNFVLTFGADETFLGDKEVLLKTLSGDTTLMRERVANKVAYDMGVPSQQHRYVHLYLNGVERTTTAAPIYYDAQKVDRSAVRQWVPKDSGGDLFSAELWWKTATFPLPTASTAFGASLQPFLNANQKDLLRYRWNWVKLDDSLRTSSYESLLTLVDVLNQSPSDPNVNYRADLESLVDIEEWMRVLALEHLLSHRDSYGYSTNHNLVAYRPLCDQWRLFPTQLKLVMGRDVSTSHSDSIFQGFSDGALLSNLITHPVFRRAYLRALRDALDGPFVSASLNQYMTAMDTGLNNGDAINPSGQNTALTTLQSWISSRITTVTTALAAEDGTFSIDVNSQELPNTIVISGKAPLKVATIKVSINGGSERIYPTVWALTGAGVKPTSWTIRVPYSGNVTTLAFKGYDGTGGLVSGATGTLNVNYTAPSVPLGLVINEILHHPVQPGAEFVEIKNNSNVAVDLSGYRIPALNFVFDNGTVVKAGEFVVVVRCADVFVRNYGFGKPIVGEFSPNLPAARTTLQLLMPEPAQTIVDQVTYDVVSPWPGSANTAGSSLQLIDANQDNDRVGNWGAVTGAFAATPGSQNTVAASLPGFASVVLNEVQPNNLTGFPTGPTPGQSWVELYNSSGTSVNLTGYGLTDNYSSLSKWIFPAGTTIPPASHVIVYLDGTGVGNHTSFVVSGAAGSLALVQGAATGTPVIVDYLDYVGIEADRSFGCLPNGDRSNRQRMYRATPNGSNTDYVPVFFNELMASQVNNLPAYVDPADGNGDDWIELYNADTRAVDLSGFTLTDTLPVPGTSYTLPAGTVIEPGAYLTVWADNDVGQNTYVVGEDITEINPDIHTQTLRLSAAGETLSLQSKTGVLIDQVAFGALQDNESFRRLTDGSAIWIHDLDATPKKSNAPRLVAIGFNPSTGLFKLKSSGVVGTTWQLQASADLSTWISLGDPIALQNNAAKLFEDPSPDPARVYRLFKPQTGEHSANLIGFTRITIPARAANGTGGNALVANHFINQNNSLAVLLPSPPLNTEFRKWNPATQTEVTYVWNGSWSPSASETLLPGEGAFIRNPGQAPLTIGFFGEVLQGVQSTTIPPQISYRSAPVPLAGSPVELGFPTVSADTVARFNKSTQAYDTYTFNGSSWQPTTPILQVGEAFKLTSGSAASRNWSLEAFAVNAPTISVSATDPAAAEPGSDIGTFTVSRFGACDTALPVSYAMSGGANNGQDYAALSGLLTLAAQPTFTTTTGLNLTPLDDSVVEAPETASLQILRSSKYFLGAVVAAQVVITDNDFPPSITQQPASQTITSGGPVTFSVTAAGSPVLTYEWQFNGIKISDATGPSFTIPAVHATHAGEYRVIVRNSFGTATSSVASLTVRGIQTAVLPVAAETHDAVLRSHTLDLPSRVLQVYSRGQFPLGPLVIQELRFRLDPEFAQQVSDPFSDITGRLDHITVNLSTIPGPSEIAAPDPQLSAAFSGNIGPSPVTVFDGAVTMTGRPYLGPAAGPKLFELAIPFTLPFFYDPRNGSNLVVEIQNFSGATDPSTGLPISLEISGVAAPYDGAAKLHAGTPNAAFGTFTNGVDAIQFVFTRTNTPTDLHVLPRAFSSGDQIAGAGTFLVPMRAQQVYGTTELPPVPILITALRFRPDYHYGGPFSTTLAKVEVSLSTTTRSPDGLSTVFANNLGADNTLVYSGALPLSSSFTGPTNGPKAFDLAIPLTTPFVFNPAAGNLLIETKNFFAPPTPIYLSSSGDQTDAASRMFAANPNATSGVTDSGADAIELTYVRLLPPAPTVIVPTHLASTDQIAGAGTLDTAMRSQQVYHRSAFPAKPLYLTGVRFRPDLLYAASVHVINPHLKIVLSSTAQAPDGLSATFVSNLDANATQAYDGPVYLETSATGPVEGPKQFDILITFSAAFPFDPTQNKNLLIETWNYQDLPVWFKLSGAGVPWDNASRVFSTNLGSSTGSPDTGADAIEFLYRDYP